MPVMYIDGKQYAQSNAIARYLGRQYGLAGANIEEDFEIDQSVEYLKDIQDKAVYVRNDKLDGADKVKHADFTKKVDPAMLDKLDAMLKENNGFSACGKLTWADFVFAGIYEEFKSKTQKPDLDSRYPSFKKLEQTVYSLPKVQAWAKTAPKKCKY